MSNENALEGPVSPKQPKAARAFWRRMATFAMGAVIMAAGVLIGARYRHVTQTPAYDGPRIVAWAVCETGTRADNGPPTILDGINFATVERTRDGNIEFQFAQPMSDDNFAVLTSGQVRYTVVNRHDRFGFGIEQADSQGSARNYGLLYVAVVANR